MCELTLSAFKRPCATPSGITSVIISDVFANDAAGLSFTVADGAASIVGTGGKAYRINQDDFVATLTQPITADRASNSFMYELTLEMKLDGTSAAINTLVSEMVRGRVVAFAVYTNGDIKAIGIERDYKGDIHKLLVTEKTTKTEIDTFYKGLEKKVEPKKKPTNKAK